MAKPTAKLKFKKPPVNEVQTAQSWSYDKALFSDDSPYFEALRSTKSLLQKYRSNLTEAAWAKFRTLLVHECEMAKKWQALWVSKDDPQRATAEWLSSSRTSLIDVKKLIQKLQTMDDRHGYNLREVFYRSAQIAISPNEETSSFFSDNTLEEGGFDVPTGGPVAQVVETQLLLRLFHGQFNEWLGALDKEISLDANGFRLGQRIGPMFLDPPLSDASIAKRDATQLAIIALIGRLRKALTIASRSGQQQMPSYDSIGGEMPVNPLAAWGILHQFVLATFKLQPEDLDLNALKQRWSSATKGRKMHFSAWPEPVQRQAN